jgi:hypothetical protein
MGRLAEAMRSSRNTMLTEESKQSHEAVRDYFGITDGDIIEYHRNTSTGPVQTTARVLSCDGCYYNAKGGYTAQITVLPLLVGGNLGGSKQIMIATQGNRIRQVSPHGHGEQFVTVVKQGG